MYLYSGSYLYIKFKEIIVHFLQQGDVHTLYIPEVFYEDAGKFTVKAENEAGQVSSSADLKVEGECYPILLSRFL